MPPIIKEILVFIGSIILGRGWRFTMSFFPARLKVKELFYWHIERQEPEHHAWHHCHEYNFAGEVSINPRVKSIIIEFYLELPMENKQVLRVECNVISLNIPHKIIPDEPIVDNYTFQVRLESEIKVPSRAYVVMRFSHGKAKRKVSLKLDNEYRFTHHSIYGRAG